MTVQLELTPAGLYFPDTAGIAIPTAEETARFKLGGLIIDTEGRPLHPEFLTLLGERGARFGKGEFYRWGPNYTVDPVIIATEYGKNGRVADDRVLTIIRKSNGKRALPGGFVDLVDGVYENKHSAAVREALEETSVNIARDRWEILYDEFVRDDRETANAWPHTTAFLFRHPEFSPAVAGDDAVPGSAEWLRFDELDMKHLHGSHARLIRLGFEAVWASRAPQV